MKNNIFAKVIVLALLAASIIPIVPATPVAAASGGSCGDTDANFLGFPTWYRGLPLKDCKIDLQGKAIGLVIVTVALNVLDIMLRIAGIVAVGFIVWGGFQYVTARGVPANLAKAKMTITSAIVGFIIAIISASLVGFLAGRFGQ